MKSAEVRLAMRDWLVAALTILFKGLHVVAEVFRLNGWLRILRHARWKARLGALGNDTVIYRSVVIHNPEHVRVGARCAVAEFVHMWGGGGITIGNDVLIASHTVITSLTHDKLAQPFRHSTLRSEVMIGDNVWIGAGAIILPGVTLGSDSIIGAGAVVTRDVAAGSVVMGVPAKPIPSVPFQTAEPQRA